MNLKHQFLISMPSLHSTYFGNTLIYIAEHSDEGALGFIVNRETTITLPEVFEQLKIADVVGEYSQPFVLEGGPVSTERGFLLYADADTAQIEMSASLDMLDQISSGSGPEDYMLLVGYAGWDEGQLESEIAQNSWLTCPCDTDVLFNRDASKKFTLASGILGVDLALMSADAGHA